MGRKRPFGCHRSGRMVLQSSPSPETGRNLSRRFERDPEGEPIPDAAKRESRQVSASATWDRRVAGYQGGVAELATAGT